MAARRASAVKKESGIGSKLVWIVTRIVLPLAVVYGVIWWRVDAGVSRIFESIQGFTQASRGSSFFGLNGDVGVNRVRIDAPAGSSLPGAMRIERVTVHTPGLWWLIRSSLFGVEEKFPERVGLTLDNFELSGVTPQMQAENLLGTYSGAPFEADGCGSRAAWERGDLGTLGLSVQHSKIVVRMNRLGADAVEFVISAGTPGAGIAEGMVTLTAPGVDANPTAFAAATPASAAASTAATATAPAAAPAAPPAPVQEAKPLVTFGGGKNAFAVQPMEYDELRQNVGREVVVRTQNGTTRRGALVRFSGSNLDIQLGARDGGFQLSIPKRDVRDVGVVVDSGESAPVQGNSNAKKN